MFIAVYCTTEYTLITHYTDTLFLFAWMCQWQVAMVQFRCFWHVAITFSLLRKFHWCIARVRKFQICERLPMWWAQTRPVANSKMLEMQIVVKIKQITLVSNAAGSIGWLESLAVCYQSPHFCSGLVDVPWCAFNDLFWLGFRDRGRKWWEKMCFQALIGATVAVASCWKAVQFCVTLG